MLHKIDKAGTSRAYADRLLATQTRAMSHAFVNNVAAATRPAIIRQAQTLLTAGKLNEAVALVLDQHVGNFANAVGAVFVDTASAECAALSRKLVMKAPTVSLSFNVADPRAVRLMQANRLAYVQYLTQQQQVSLRAALVRATREGLGTEATSRLVRQAIGLNPLQQRQLKTFAAAQRRASAEEIELPEAQRGPVFNQRQIDELVERQAANLLRTRAERIARTESLRIVGQAREQALRQSIEATGQRTELSGKEWASTHDSRTRDAHSARDGMRRRLNEAFAPGIMRPGDGGPEEAVNCRCTLLFEFFDTESELQEWLRGGS